MRQSDLTFAGPPSATQERAHWPVSRVWAAMVTNYTLPGARPRMGPLDRFREIISGVVRAYTLLRKYNSKVICSSKSKKMKEGLHY